MEVIISERNSPCPCGSGKKYKKCCGVNATSAHPPDPIAINRAVAYKGNIGHHRRAFCETYASAKKESLAEIETRLRQWAADTGKSITCHKGCGHCCAVYVFANLQESESITHYLYEHEDVLQHYLQQYPRWKERADRLFGVLSRIDKSHEKILLGSATEEDKRIFDEDLAAYAAQQNPCPFLRDNACTIYDVRPYVCAGIVSINSPEYCMPEHPLYNKKALIKAGFLPQNDMPYFMTTQSTVNFGCMPALVQQLLKHGYAFLSTIGGLESLRHQTVNDPEIRSTLAQFGI